MTSMLGRPLRASATQWFTYFRRASHLTFLPLASALHAMIASFRATLSALDILAASAGINAVPLASIMAIMHVNRAVAKRDIMHFPGLLLCDELTINYVLHRGALTTISPPKTNIPAGVRCDLRHITGY